MKRHISRRFLLGSALSTLAGVVLANPPVQSLRPRTRAEDIFKRAAQSPEALVKASGLSGEVGFIVADAKTGVRLEEYKSAASVPPASVAKAMTALYALDNLGAAHRFQTRLIATGSVNNGILEGDLVLAGGGDPTLNTNALAGLASALKGAGVREVRGAFKVYDGALPLINSIDPDQPEHVGYSPALSGIALNYNRVHFQWKRASNGYKVTMDARSNKYRPEVVMSRMRVTDRSTPVYTYKSTTRQDQWSVARAVLGKGGARWLPVRKPALYAGDVFRTMARSNGIQLRAAKVVQRVPVGAVLATHSSEALLKILRDMLRYSTNVTAEMVGMAATVKRSGKPKSLKASASEMNRWCGVALGMKSVALVDHSGLNGASRISANDMVQALVQVRTREILEPILKQVELRNAKGEVNKNHPIKVNAKTGTLNFVSGLAGYMIAQDGTVLAFAIFTADQKKRARLKRAERERPQGARSWNRRAKKLQQKLIERWGLVYGS